MGRGLGPDETNSGLHQSHAAARSAGEMAARWFETLLPRHLEIIYEINRRLLDDVRTRFPATRDVCSA